MSERDSSTGLDFRLPDWPCRASRVLRCLLCLLPAFPAGAADTPFDRLAEKWRWRIFDRAEGVSPGAVTVIYQDVADFIYAATDRGLCRYNLHHWEIIENAEPFEHGKIVSIVESRDVIYCASRRALWSVQGGRKLLRIYPEGEGVSGRLFLAASRLGEVFVIDEAGGRTHYQIRDRIEPVDEVRIPMGPIRDYQIDQHGVHWLATELGLYYRDLARGRGSWTEVSELDLPFPKSECLRFLSLQVPPQTPLPRTRRLAKARELWGVFQPRGEPSEWSLARLEDRVWIPAAGEVADSPLESVTPDAEGNYYATCENGSLFFFEAGSDRWQRVENLGIGQLAKLRGGLLDSRGNLWFRLGAGGVAFVNLRSTRWNRLPGLSGPPYPKVLCFLETAAGELWAGTEHGCVRYRQGLEVAAELEAGEPILYQRLWDTDLRMVTALGEDGQGRIWAGSESFRGVFSFDSASGAWRHRGLSETIHRIVADYRGELWFLPGDDGKAARQGAIHRLSAFSANELRAVPLVGRLPREFLSGGLAVNDLVRTQTDVFWLATEVGLLECQLEEGQLIVQRRLTDEDGLVSLRVWKVEEGPDGSIWACYPSSGRGVTRIDSQGTRLTHYDVRHGLGSPEVWTIARSGQDLWFGTGAGLSRYDGQCWYSSSIASADPHSGLVFAILVPKETLRQGTLILGTQDNGILRFQSDDNRRPRFSLLEFPERAGKDGKIEFRWRARDYKNQTAPKDLVYRYRVDDEAWQSNRNVDSVVYEGLAEGRHRFELEVRDLDGNHNRENVSHVFHVPPATYSWVAALSLGAGGTTIALLLLWWGRLRLRQRDFLSRYRGFYRAYPAPVVVVDRSGRIRDYNGREPEMLGLRDARSEDVIGRPLEMVPAFAPLRLGSSVEAALRGERFRVRGYGVGGEGEERVLEVRGFPLTADSAAAIGPSARGAERPGAGEAGRVEGVAVVVDDITRRLEEQRLQARERRLQGMRELARRLSGDLRHLMESLKSLARDAVEQQGGSEGGALGARLGDMEDTVGKLLQFSRTPREAAPSVPLDMEEVLRPLLGRCDDGSGGTRAGAGALPFGRHVELDYRSQTGLWPVLADKEVLRSALDAVLRNAAEAMLAPGRLTVRASNIRLQADPGSLPEGSYIELTVKDDGPGIDPNQLETVFDPFYSTKPRDRAKGLGLSIAYAMIRSQGGDIRVHSRPGAGTTVRVLLPARR